MKLLKHISSFLLVALVASSQAPGSSTAPNDRWVQTFASAGSSQIRPGDVIHLDYGVQNYSDAAQTVTLVGVLVHEDGFQTIVHSRETLTLQPGEGQIYFGSFVLPDYAPEGNMQFIVGAYVHGPWADLQGPRIVQDSDFFRVQY